MKTTIEIPEAVLREARKLASREKTTAPALVEEGLRQVLDTHARAESFRLRKATFKGKGLQPDVAGTSWKQIRDMVYEGRGG